MSPRKKKQDEKAQDETIVEGMEVVSSEIPGEEADDEITLDENVRVAPVTEERGPEEPETGDRQPETVQPEAVQPVDEGQAPGGEGALEPEGARGGEEALEIGPADAEAPAGDAARELAELLEKAGAAPLVPVPVDRAPAVQLSVAEWLGSAVDVAPEFVDGRGLPARRAGDAARMLAREEAGLGRILLVAAAQRDMPVWWPVHSFELALRDAAFRRLGATLELLLERQLLVGEIGARPAVPLRAEQLLGVEELTLTLDTPGHALAELGRMDESLARLTAQPDLLLDEARIDGLVARAQEMAAALGDAAEGGLTGPLEVGLEVGSFWTAAFGGVYRLAARPPILVLAGARNTGGDVETVRLTDPGLIDRLHASGFLTYDTSQVEQRTRELEEWSLAQAGVDPGTMDDATRRRTVAGRARTMPRTWHELVIVRRAVQGGPSGARVVHTLSAETKVKLSRPLKDVPVITRLLAELDAVDVVRQFAAAPDRFARDFLAAAPLVRQHMARAVLGSLSQAVAPPPPPEPAPPEPEEDDEEILFL